MYIPYSKIEVQRALAEALRIVQRADADTVVIAQMAGHVLAAFESSKLVKVHE